MSTIFDKLDSVVERYNTLTERLADPSIYDKADEFKKTTQERANIEEIVTTYSNFKKVKTELFDAKEILRNESDPELREMAKEEVLEKEVKIQELEQQLKILLLPKDPLDERNVIMEIRAGAGGDEASIFVADLYRMYTNYFKDLNFKIEVDSISSNSEGIKEIIFTVSGEKVYSKLKYESGVHRVQRVPKTEAQGRVHTSTVTVAVLPEAEELDFELDMNDVRVEISRSGGAGGQHVNKTNSAVRMVHIPTGIDVNMEEEKSQHKNREKAIKVLRARIYDKMLQEKNAKEALERKELVGTGDRSERIRTYNFPQGRLTDHRIGLTLYSLDRIIDGDLSPVTDALIAHRQAEQLKGTED